MAKLPIILDIRERLRVRGKANPDTGCLEWQGYLSHRGYGVVTYRGRKQSVHRVAWEVYRGSVPNGLVLCHRCDNPKCYNLDHLFLGTQADNMQDAANKGRLRSGTEKLTYELASEIRRRYHRSVSRGRRYTHGRLSRIYGVDRSVVGKIVRNQIWTTPYQGHETPPYLEIR